MQQRVEDTQKPGILVPQGDADQIMAEFDRSVATPSPEAAALAGEFHVCTCISAAELDQLAAKEEECLEAMFFNDH